MYKYIVNKYVFLFQINKDEIIIVLSSNKFYHISRKGK